MTERLLRESGKSCQRWLCARRSQSHQEAQTRCLAGSEVKADTKRPGVHSGPQMQRCPPCVLGARGPACDVTLAAPPLCAGEREDGVLGTQW